MTSISKTVHNNTLLGLMKQYSYTNHIPINMKSIDVTGDAYISFLKKAKLMVKNHVKHHQTTQKTFQKFINKISQKKCLWLKRFNYFTMDMFYLRH